MNTAAHSNPTTNVPPDDVRRLHGKTVLVKSTKDRRNPPTGVRGYIEVHDKDAGCPEVSIALEFPQMFTSRAHHRVIPLDQAAVAKLLSCECNGTYEYTIDQEIE
jgi:hypothetical protein